MKFENHGLFIVLAACTILVVALMWKHQTQAEPEPDPNRARAEWHAATGAWLYLAGHTDEACWNLREAARLDPNVVTIDPSSPCYEGSPIDYDDMVIQSTVETLPGGLTGHVMKVEPEEER